MADKNQIIHYICRNPECRRKLSLDLTDKDKKKKMLFGAKPLDRISAQSDVYIISCPNCGTLNTVKASL